MSTQVVTDSDGAVFRCVRVIDEREQIICNKPASDEVFVRNQSGLYCVALCEECKQGHYEFYESRRRGVGALPEGSRRKGYPFSEHRRQQDTHNPKAPFRVA